jgi:hypothetical protein
LARTNDLAYFDQGINKAFVETTLETLCSNNGEIGRKQFLKLFGGKNVDSRKRKKETIKIHFFTPGTPGTTGTPGTPDTPGTPGTTGTPVSSKIEIILSIQEPAV